MSVPVPSPNPRTCPLEGALVPHPVELAALFQQFMRYWTGAECKYRPLGPPFSPEKPVELFVQWAGSIRGAFLLRIPRPLLEEWGDNRTLQRLNLSGVEELLREMGSLFSVFMMHSLWMDEFFEMGPVLARVSRPSDWPAGSSQVGCAMEVDHHPVEMGLWMEFSPETGQ